MIHQPEQITFTGVDAYTDLDRLINLDTAYKGKVEWGILFSEKQRNRGNLRYPPKLLIDEIRWHGLRLSAHFCGALADDINRGDFPEIDLDGFLRVQVNHASPNIDALNEFSRITGIEVIAQSRDPFTFPTDQRVSWLFDPSGGRGERPEKLPIPEDAKWCGYAGGINPENVATVVSQISASCFWIDMETGVRNEHDLFDLDKCEAVLKAVFGGPTNERVKKGPADGGSYAND